MYIIIALWSLILFFITIFQAFKYIIDLCRSSKSFIERHLQRTETETDNGTAKNNLTNLRPDDVLVLKLIKANTSDYDLSFIIRELNDI